MKLDKKPPKGFEKFFKRKDEAAKSSGKFDCEEYSCPNLSLKLIHEFYVSTNYYYTENLNNL